MYSNISTEDFEHIEIFGQPALLSNSRIDSSSLPNGWFCYDLRGSDDDPGEPVTLEYKVNVNYAGTILSPALIKIRNDKDYRYIRGQLSFLGESITFAEFCKEHDLPVPTEYADRSYEQEFTL